MAEKEPTNKEPVNCKCGGIAAVVDREYCAQVICTECGRTVTRTTRESAIKAWNGWMTRTEKAKAKRRRYGYGRF